MVYDLLKQQASATQQLAAATQPSLNSLSNAAQPSFVPRGNGMDMRNHPMTQGPGSMMGFGGIDNGMGLIDNMMATNRVGGFPGFPDNMGLMPGGGGGGGGGAMSGIMDTINSSYGEMDNAMQGAFDTIKQSLSNNYTSQEVLVPNNGGGGMTNTPPGGIGNAHVMPPMMRPGPDINSILPNFQKMPIENMISNFGPQYNMIDPNYSSPGFGGEYLEQGGPAFSTYNGNQFEGGPAPMEINQDNNQQQISQQQEIDDMFAGMSGQFNGAQ